MKPTTKILKILLVSISAALALPDGPPEEACEHMLPGRRMGEIGLEGHLSSPQNIFPTYGNSKIPPYYILISPNANQYSPSQPYSVYIVANQSVSHNYYKGLILQARRVVCASNDTVEVEEEPYGTFIVNASTLLKTMECTHAGSTISHKSPQLKINESATWHSPDEYVGHLIFWGTVVQSANFYWTEFYSSVLQDPTVPPAPICMAPISHSSFVLIISAVFLVVYNTLTFTV